MIEFFVKLGMLGLICVLSGACASKPEPSGPQSFLERVQDKDPNKRSAMESKAFEGFGDVDKKSFETKKWNKQEFYQPEEQERKKFYMSEESRRGEEKSFAGASDQAREAGSEANMGGEKSRWQNEEVAPSRRKDFRESDKVSRTEGYAPAEKSQESNSRPVMKEGKESASSYSVGDIRRLLNKD